jgi:hypothetical protein
LAADRDGDKMVVPSSEDLEIVEDSEPEREHQRQLDEVCQRDEYSRRVADSEVIDISDDSDVDGELSFSLFIIC